MEGEGSKFMTTYPLTLVPPLPLGHKHKWVVGMNSAFLVNSGLSIKTTYILIFLGGKMHKLVTL